MTRPTSYFSIDQLVNPIFNVSTGTGTFVISLGSEIAVLRQDRPLILFNRSINQSYF